MESSEIVKALVDKEDIDLVIVVDALCAKNYRKLAHVIQISFLSVPHLNYLDISHAFQLLTYLLDSSYHQNNQSYSG